ncbi:MAG: glycosyltransferase family 39 protein [Geminicoccaceae bacterium]|nr:glycosyltransferase family 39 protein [Geminicoccaceae bacterium]
MIRSELFSPAADRSLVAAFAFRKISLLFFALCALVLWSFLALDARHHPDEGLYLYLAAYADVRTLLDPREAPAYPFYVSRILHLLIARAIFALCGPGGAAVQLLAVLYAFFVLAAILLGTATVRRLVTWRAEMAFAVPLLATSPVLVWLVGKTLPESPALLATSLALYAFVRSLEAPELRRALPWSMLAAVALVAVALTRNAFLLAPCTLGATLLLFRGWRFPFGRVLARGVLVGGLAVSLSLAALVLLGIAPSAYFWVYGIAGAEHAPWAVRLYAGVMAVGPLLAIFPVVPLHRPRVEAVFFLVWFAFATGAVYLLLADVETRYLLVNLVPLLGLGCLGIGALAARLGARPGRALLAFAVFVVTAGVLGRAAQPFLEHEVKADQLDTVIATLDREYRDGYTLLTAWHHSDYHYLRVVYPHRRIHSVERSHYRRSVTVLDEEDRRFYGDGILLDFDALARVPRPWIYVGFEANPAIANVRRLVAHLPFAGLRAWAFGIVEKVAKRRHFYETWVWREPRIRVVPLFEHGHYRVAELVLAERPANRSGAGEPLLP